MSEVAIEMLTEAQLQKFEKAVALELIHVHNIDSSHHNNSSSLGNDNSYSNIARHAFVGGMYREARKYVGERAMGPSNTP